MTVLVASDSFKGTYSAAEVAAAIAAGVRDAGGKAVQLPVADGGEGTFDALCRGLAALAVAVQARNPWGEPIPVTIGLTADGTAVVELAQASGLTVPTTTFLDAPRVFGPQKGAGPTEIEVLEQRLRQLARSYPRNPAGVPRTGAAGGLSGGLWAHFSAELVSGAGAVLDAVNFDRCLASADAVVVGEGRLDSQTGQGKIISAILERVQESGRRIPVVAVVGSVAEDLGSYAGNFTEIIVASDSAAMFAAGRAVAGYSASRLGLH